MTAPQTPGPHWRDPVGLEPDGTISTGGRMSAETSYRERLRETFHLAAGIGIFETTVDTQAGTEAVAAQVLNDLLAYMAEAEYDPYPDMKGSNLLVEFAADRGIDLGEQP